MDVQGEEAADVSCPQLSDLLLLVTVDRQWSQRTQSANYQHRRLACLVACHDGRRNAGSAPRLSIRPWGLSFELPPPPIHEQINQAAGHAAGGIWDEQGNKHLLQREGAVGQMESQKMV